jgi:hypothetical protein
MTEDAECTTVSSPYQRCRGGSPESRERGQSNHLIAAHRTVARKPCPKEQASVDTSIPFGCFVPPMLLLAGRPVPGMLGISVFSVS